MGPWGHGGTAAQVVVRSSSALLSQPSLAGGIKQLMRAARGRLRLCLHPPGPASQGNVELRLERYDAARLSFAKAADLAPGIAGYHLRAAQVRVWVGVGVGGTCTCMCMASIVLTPP